MRSFRLWHLASLVGLTSLASTAAVGLRPAQFTEPILEINEYSLTTCTQDSPTVAQDIRLSTEFRGVALDGTEIASSTTGMAFAGNPFEPTASGGCGTQVTTLNPATGTPVIQEIDIALPSLGPQWIISRSYNPRQISCPSTYHDSDGEQGRNWFQDSRPEILIHEATSDADDVLLLYYRADAYLEFARTSETSHSYKGTNGACGIFQQYEATGNDPDYYVYTDMHGTEYSFFGSGASKAGAVGQLWKIEDNAGNTAYVGHATDPSDAVDSGFDAGGSVTTAYDGSGRKYTYKYPTTGTKRLEQVKVQLPNEVVVAQVDYEYYVDEDHGSPGDLKLVTVTDLLTDSGISVERKTYYRYWGDSTYNASTHPGHPYGLKYVVAPEGTRAFDWLDDTWDEDFLTATNSALEPYASLYLEYDSSHRVSASWSAGMCGCSSSSNGRHEYTYGDNGSFSGSSGYDSGWHRRVITKGPNETPHLTGVNTHTYTTQYLDETGQRLSRVVTDSDPGSGSPGTWVYGVTRDGNGMISAEYSPAAVTGYTHTSGSITYSSAAGLVRTYNRASSGTTKGYALTEYISNEAGDDELYQHSWSYDEQQLALSESTVVRPFIDEETIYEVETTTGSSGARTTSYAYTFHTIASLATLAIEEIETEHPIVSTSKNGPGGTKGWTEAVHFREDGLVDFVRAADDIITYMEYQDGQLALRIHDADTSLTASGQDFYGKSIPSGFGTTGSGALHKKYEYTHDNQKRLSQTAKYRGSTADWSELYYSKLKGGELVTLSFPKLDKSTGDRFGPVRLWVTNHAGSTVASGVIAIPTGKNSSSLTAYIDETEKQVVDAVGVGTLGRLSAHGYREEGTQRVSMDAYHLIPSSGAGSEGTNYDRTSYAYDPLGRRIRMVDPTGTIDRTEYDALGRIESASIGTNDYGELEGASSGTNNMAIVEAREYDGGADGGNSHLTTVVKPVDSISANDRETEYIYDYRGRMLLVSNPLPPHAFNEYDNLGRVVATGLYSDPTDVTIGTTVASSTSAQSGRLALSTASFDELGRMWKATRHEISSTGASTATLDALYWYDPMGREVKMDGEQLTKTAYDRLGRETNSYALAIDNDSANNYSQVLDISDDLVLEERQTLFDAEDDTISMQVRIDRHHDEYGGTPADGPLDGNSSPLVVSSSVGRPQITAYWYDEIDRVVERVEYGTNGGSSFDRSTPGDTPPARSDTTLRTSYTYDGNGEVEEIEDPRSLVTHIEYDGMGRVTRELRNYDDAVASGAPSGTDDNQTVLMSYTDGLLQAITADLPSGSTDQVTTYVYGVTGSDSPGPSGLSSNRLLREIQYPDKANADDVVRQAYNVQRELIWRRDQGNNRIEIDRDKAGRVLHRRVQTLGTGFDGAVRRVSTTFDDLGRRDLVTQYDAATAGNVVDEVRFTYNGWGAIASFQQDRNSAVNTSGAGDDYEVQYLYETETSGRNALRRTQMVTPHGKNVYFVYDSTAGLFDDAASRVTSVKFATLELAAYEYNGLATLVGTEYQQPSMYSKLHDGSTYDGLDRFNRVVNSRWTKDVTPPTNFVDVTISYDRGSNIVLTEDDVLVDYSPSTVRKFDVAYTMDGLNRLTEAEVGEWGGSSMSSTQRSQDWVLDHVGNWDRTRVDLNGDGDWADTGDFEDHRTHSTANEIVDRYVPEENTLHWTVEHDKVGNLEAEVDQANWTDGRECTYDAFGRLRKVHASDAGVYLAEYKYNGLGYRISELIDTDGDGDADGSDVWFHTAYDSDWRALCLYRADDTEPKIEYVNHQAGLSGLGGSSYIDDVIRRRRDTSTAWASEAGDGTWEEKLFYCQSWRSDVVAVADFRGYVLEYVTYSSYGIPYGVPVGDDDGSGDTDATVDGGRIQNRIDALTNWDYCVLGDTDLDRDVDGDDKAAVLGALDGVVLGYGQLGAIRVDNRVGWAGLSILHGAAGWAARNRVARPDLGRWMSRDPLEYVDGLSLYSHTASNPVAWVDPYGLKRQCETCCIRIKCAPLPIIGRVGIQHCWLEYSDCGEEQWHTVELWQSKGGRGTHVWFDRPGATHGVGGAGTPQAIFAQCYECQKPTYDVPQADEISPCQCIKSEALNYSHQGRYNPTGPNSNTFAARMAMYCGLIGEKDKGKWPGGAVGYDWAVRRGPVVGHDGGESARKDEEELEAKGELAKRRRMSASYKKVEFRGPKF